MAPNSNSGGRLSRAISRGLCSPSLAARRLGHVEVGTSEDRVLIRVCGRATHLLAQPMTSFARQMLKVGYRKYELDLGECESLDSTIAGVLAGISMKLDGGPGTVILRRLPAQCKDLLDRVGVFRFFDPESDGPALDIGRFELQALPLAACSLEAWTATVIEAHQLLVKADAKNEPRFKELLEFLGTDLSSEEAVIPLQLPEQGLSRWKH